MSSQTASDVELIVAELITNSVEHRPAGLVGLDLAVVDEAIYVSVANRSDDSATNLVGPAGRSDDGVVAERGRGLQIVSALADGVWVHGETSWTSVTCVKRFGQSSG